MWNIILYSQEEDTGLGSIWPVSASFFWFLHFACTLEPKFSCFFTPFSHWRNGKLFKRNLDVKPVDVLQNLLFIFPTYSLFFSALSVSPQFFSLWISLSCFLFYLLIFYLAKTKFIFLQNLEISLPSVFFGQAPHSLLPRILSAYIWQAAVSLVFF